MVKKWNSAASGKRGPRPAGSLTPGEADGYHTHMVTMDQIRATVDDIVREFAPLKVILFGSYAYGTPNEDSDVDLLVIVPGELDELRAINRRIYMDVPWRFRRDIIVRSPEEIAFRLSHNDFFLREIIGKGRVLYESAHAGVG